MKLPKIFYIFFKIVFYVVNIWWFGENVLALLLNKYVFMEEVSQSLNGQIVGWLKGNDRKLSWLSKVSEINYNTLYSIVVKGNMKMTDKWLSKINQALGTNFQK